MLLNFKNWCISIQCKSCCLKSLKIDFFREKKVFSKCNFFAIQVIFLQQPLNLTAPAYSIWNTDTFHILHYKYKKEKKTYYLLPFVIKRSKKLQLLLHNLLSYYHD